MAEARAPTLDRPELPELDQESISLGMWIFLASEVMFFGALFAAYIIYRNAYPQAFAEASRHLNVWIGSVNTGLLLTSSLTVALAVNAAQLGKRKLLIAFLLLTIVLGLIFLGLKGLEYSQEFEENLFSGEKLHLSRTGARKSAPLLQSLFHHDRPSCSAYAGWFIDFFHHCPLGVAQENHPGKLHLC